MTIIEEENALPGRRQDVPPSDELAHLWESPSGVTAVPLPRRDRRRARAARRRLLRLWWASAALALVVVVVAAASAVFWGSDTASTSPLHAPASRVPAHVAPPTAAAPAPAHASSPDATAKALALLAGPPGPGWSVTQTFGPSSYTLTAVACPSSTQCVAVGETTFNSGMVLVSADGGTTWAQHNVPSGVGTLSAVACPAANTCIAVGGATAITTTDGGATWRAAALGDGSLTAVSCPAAGTCVAAGSVPASASGCPSGATYATSDGGQTWKATATPCFVATGVACATTTHCIAVGTHGTGASRPGTGAILRSGDAGATWQPSYTLARAGTQLNAVACPSGHDCIAVGNAPGQAILRTGDGGLTWTPQVPHGTVARSYFLTVSCGSATDCQAAGAGMPVSTADAGATWALRGSSNDITKVLGVSCPTGSACVGVAWDALAVPATIKLS